MIRSFCVYPLLAILFFSCNNKTQSKLEEIIELENYPSASAIEYLDGDFYIIGDDAPSLLILNKDLVIKDSIYLYAWVGKRMPKDIKPDNESIAVYDEGDGPRLYIFGSGSLSSYRNMYRIIRPNSLETKSNYIDTLYTRIKKTGPSELNIEGAAHIPGFFCLSNRGHQSYPKNHLIFISDNFTKDEINTEIRMSEVMRSKDTGAFTGISGLAYSPKNDRLLMSVTTEDTKNGIEDGVIGKSYLWFVNKISSKTLAPVIQPDQVIDLESIDKRFKGHKVESLCIVEENDNSYHLVLVADNDNGSSTIFRMIVGKD
jgi:hypothetical protein